MRIERDCFVVKISYPEGRGARDHLRDALRRRGRDSVDDFAAGIREQWGYGYLRSYRLALELSQEQVCEQVNRLQGTFAGDAGYFDHSLLSRLERWPGNSRRPTVGQLVGLARVFGTSPRQLVASVDWDKLSPADRLALNALDQTARSGATEPATGVGMMGAARPHAGDAPLVPSNRWAGSEAIRSRDPIERLVLMAGEESAQYADRGGNIGETTLDQLRTQTAEQARRFAGVPLLDLFGSVRLLRDRIFSYLDGGQPIRQRRDLYFLAGVSCGMLANITNDLGHPSAAMSQARAGHVFAMEAGDPALTGWLYAQQSTFCYWNGQPGKAREYARRGTALHPMGTVGVWLHSLEARAYGELGNAEGVRSALRRASEARELAESGTLDTFGGFMTFSRAKQHFYAAGTYLGISDNAAVIAEARSAAETYENGPAEDCAYDNIASAQFHAAAAHIRAGELDAAQESAQSALDIGPEHRRAHVDKSARRLHQHLCATDVRNSPLAIGTRDQIEDFLTTTPAHPELL